MPLSSAEFARYSRHLNLNEFGLAGQEKLKAARVLVVGAGGLGSPALLYLAAAGVGTIGIVDFDTVDVSNLQRQVLFTHGDIGQQKTLLIAARLQALNPHVQIEAHTTELHAGNVMDIVARYDVVLDGTDRFSARYLVNDACVLLRKPLVSAAIHRFEGQAFTYVPQQGPCYRCLFPEPPPAGAVPNCAEAGVLGVLPGVMGTLQATEAIKLLTGLGTPLVGRLLTYDALELRFDEFRVTARDDCAVCGVQPSITQPQDSTAACVTSADAPTSYQSFSAIELHSLLQTQPSILLVDVREPTEFAAGHLPSAINIPLADLATQFRQLSTATTVVFMCRGGGRSAQACELAYQLTSTQAGQPTKIVNLQHGLNAWRQQVDPALQVI